MDRLKSKIHEVIVTTLTADGQPHHAPMGIYEVNGHFLIKPFKPSTTYDNLKRSGQCCINYIDDVRVFAGALTGRRSWPSLPCQKIDGQYLAQALAHSELQVIDIDDANPRATFTAKVKHDISHAPFRGFNRAQSAVVEAAILVSRLHMLSPDKIQSELAYLTIAIDKTAGERELEAWDWLMTKIREAGIEI
ncbi:MAG TPA: DUF447 domain-containing protein [Methylophaga sp.]|nr:DUF447 domain-containing protein [Methylophaga sp.]